MVDTVIKKDCRRQKFSKAKIERAIDKATREAKVSAVKRNCRKPKEEKNNKCF